MEVAPPVIIGANKNAMAVFQWIHRSGGDDILTALISALEQTQFIIDEVGTTELQVSAICKPNAVAGYWSGVKLIAIWQDRKSRHIRIEIRSDEPTLQSHTHCEQRAKALMKLLPPI